MPDNQYDRDQAYLVALSIFTDMHRKGIISESELGQVASFLEQKFSPSLAAKTPKVA